MNRDRGVRPLSSWGEGHESREVSLRALSSIPWCRIWASYRDLGNRGHRPMISPRWVGSSRTPQSIRFASACCDASLKASRLMLRNSSSTTTLRVLGLPAVFTWMEVEELIERDRARSLSVSSNAPVGSMEVLRLRTQSLPSATMRSAFPSAACDSDTNEVCLSSPLRWTATSLEMGRRTSTILDICNSMK